ncbi:short-chain dehydrogenase/reductase family protein, putative [Talaromyces stipitatus ATCC 10500]|uniref:Short-chain dehydrogenase/reductase family protein, putative n=1 Tax=Talaromyces stipitatus (strain ATCC 10500 / CBS 375.48 / QM 6759 / NRRL 1006) TaxID=441959 RepID=B8MTA8_TALSN|nr:short-chain dehydrogenase/reductase family protein, putative [Talaromyces stipitatus ATCC 10500]EED12358.1 short-chain dehydrogenase/reductase family protein, putative [Talaromyces stipitatus ATCC 10500]
MAGLYRLWHNKHNPPSDFSQVSFHDKTILITGATSGLGFEACLKFLRQGVSSLIISSRDHTRGQQVKRELESLTGRVGIVEVWPLDMSSFRSVAEFASRVNDAELKGRKLDVVVLNAGIMHRDFVLSPDGWEDTLQVNTLSTTLLAALLFPKLRGYDTSGAVASESDVPHLVIVSSGTAVRVSHKDLPPPPPSSSSSSSSSYSSYFSHPLLEYLNQPSTRKKYAISKLLLEYASRSLADLAHNDDGSLNVIVNTAKPGLCASSLGRQYTTRWYERWAARLFNYLFARPAEVGGRVLVSACVQGYESHGRIWKGDGYFDETCTLLAGEEGKRLKQQAWSEIVDVLQEQASHLNITLDLERTR